MANSLSSEYREYQEQYYPAEFPKRFDRDNYSTSEFKRLADDLRSLGVKHERAHMLLKKARNRGSDNGIEFIMNYKI